MSLAIRKGETCKKTWAQAGDLRLEQIRPAKANPHTSDPTPGKARFVIWPLLASWVLEFQSKLSETDCARGTSCNKCPT